MQPLLWIVRVMSIDSHSGFGRRGGADAERILDA
jgi:hypothetical protein